MPRWDGFGRSLLFAALAAAGLPVAVTFGAPLIGSAASVRVYILLVAGCYAMGLPVERSRRLAALAMAGVAGLLLAMLPLGLSGTAVGAAAIVAVGRSVIAQRQRALRACVIEAALGALALGVAGFLASGGLLALCLAIWGFFLVQSAYFLIGGRTPRRDAAPRDPFERARQRLERLLDDELGAPR
jgi:hypothetical protein